MKRSFGRLFRIFAAFFKIGAFTFGGGYAMIPLIQHEVIHRRGWIEERNFLDLLTLAQTAPGPIALNTAVFVGYKRRGYLGALSAILGVILPSFLVILVVAIFFASIRNNAYVDAAFKGMRWWLVAVALAVALVVWYFGISPVWFLIAGAVVGACVVARRGGEQC